MKMKMKMKLALGLLLGLTLVLAACTTKEEDDDSMYLTKDEIGLQSGNIKLAITGQSENGYQLNEASEFIYCAYIQPNTYTENDSIQAFTIQQFSDVIGIYNVVMFSIRYNKITTKSKVTSFYVNYTKAIDEKNIISINKDFGYSNFNETKPTISNFAFNKAAGTISGDIAANATYYGATIANKYTTTITANFNVNVKFKVNGTPSTY